MLTSMFISSWLFECVPIELDLPEGGQDVLILFALAQLNCFSCNHACMADKPYFGYLAVILLSSKLYLLPFCSYFVAM
jgi:hypothetical protein